MEINEIVRFADFLSAFPNIKRANRIKGKNDFENDSEHSYQLALITWYVTDLLKLNLNRQLILEYALAHDLVEIYAGDTYTFLNNSENHKSTKQQRESDAFERIKKEFPNFLSLHSSIERYENLVDPESKFVYILDKILPDINIYLSNDTYYKEAKVTLESWKEWFRLKIEKLEIKDEKILNLIDQLIEFQKTQEVFYK
jgi:putative hydrolase of HD superfamily